MFSFLMSHLLSFQILVWPNLPPKKRQHGHVMCHQSKVYPYDSGYVWVWQQGQAPATGTVREYFFAVSGVKNLCVHFFDHSHRCLSLIAPESKHEIHQGTGSQGSNVGPRAWASRHMFAARRLLHLLVFVPIHETCDIHDVYAKVYEI